MRISNDEIREYFPNMPTIKYGEFHNGELTLFLPDGEAYMYRFKDNSIQVYKSIETDSNSVMVSLLRDLKIKELDI